MTPPDPSLLAERARRVALVGLDVDGTLTDGRIYIGPAGEAMKAFSVRDGLGLSLLAQAGIRIALITARRSDIVARRAAELKIDTVLQGVGDKARALASVAAQAGLPLEHTAYVGDDWPDLPAMAICGLAATVADAPREIHERAHWVSERPAGDGAIREFAEFLLRAQSRWDAMLESALTGAAGARH